MIQCDRCGGVPLLNPAAVSKATLTWELVECRLVSFASICSTAKPLPPMVTRHPIFFRPESTKLGEVCRRSQSSDTLLATGAI
mmetsp:Transcript_21480/g.34764  ORF Transcript_21480/g.34764 Transcript_21480/m.34764 type:complete len:83 (+) Transcript_21480:2167-2415(+)